MIIITGCKTTANNFEKTDILIPPVPESGNLSLHLNSIPPKFNEQEFFDALVYPPGAKGKGKEGYVLAELFINKNGFIDHIQILEEKPKRWGFAKAVVNAFTDIQFIPGMIDGEPVAVRCSIPVTFKLKRK